MPSCFDTIFRFADLELAKVELLPDVLQVHQISYLTSSFIAYAGHLNRQQKRISVHTTYCIQSVLALNELYANTYHFLYCTFYIEDMATLNNNNCVF